MSDYDCYKIKGIKGTVIFNKSGICVEFDEDIGGHSGEIDNLNGKRGHCLYCAGYVKLIEDTTKKDKKMLKMLKKVDRFCPSEKGYDERYNKAYRGCGGVGCVNCWMYAIAEKLAEQDKEPTELEVVEVKRAAKIGEWVKVIDDSGHCYKLYSIHKVTGHGTGFPEWVYVDGMNRGIIKLDQYVVLENYKPAEEK